MAFESIFHLFIDCSFSKAVWQAVRELIHKRVSWNGGTIEEAWKSWWTHHPEGNLRTFPLSSPGGYGSQGIKVFFKIKFPWWRAQLSEVCLSSQASLNPSMRIYLPRSKKRISRKGFHGHILMGPPAKTTNAVLG